MQASDETVTAEAAIAAFIGDAPASDTGLTLTLPDIAEDGHLVSVEIDAPSAVEILLVAPANPVRSVMTARFGLIATEQKMRTHMRLADAQEVVALARMPDGTIRRALRQTDVLAGCCG